MNETKKCIVIEHCIKGSVNYESEKASRAGITKTQENKTLERSIANALTMKYCHSSYAERLLLSSSQSNVLAGLLTPLSPFGVTANALVIWALIKTNAIHDKCCRMNWILLAMSISDLIIGIITIPLIIVLFTKYRSIRWCDLEKATLFIGQMNLHFSGYNLFFMGLE